jgi:hypothetical protein
MVSVSCRPEFGKLSSQETEYEVANVLLDWNWSLQCFWCIFSRLELSAAARSV